MEIVLRLGLGSPAYQQAGVSYLVIRLRLKDFKPNDIALQRN
jgi:hypothetical protein